MDKILVTKMLGKHDSVILEDQIYILRDILDCFRACIITKTILKKNDIIIAKERFDKIDEILEQILIHLNNIDGYTNSKKYLEKYLENIIFHVRELKLYIEKSSEKEFIYNTNTLIDLVLKY